MFMSNIQQYVQVLLTIWTLLITSMDYDYYKLIKLSNIFFFEEEEEEKKQGRTCQTMQ